MVKCCLNFKQGMWNARMQVLSVRRKQQQGQEHVSRHTDNNTTHRAQKDENKSTSYQVFGGERGVSLVA